MAIKNSRRNVAYGYPNPQAGIFPEPIVAQRPPTTQDMGVIGQNWVDQSANPVGYYVLGSFADGGAVWSLLAEGGGAAVFSSLTVTPGPTNITGLTNINIAGAGNTVIGTGGTGEVQIGNATGNTFITGVLTVSSSIVTTDGNIGATDNEVTANGPAFQLLKNRANGTIVTGDALGSLFFAGFDGTQYTVGANITSTTSGTIAATRVASNLQFFTHPDAPAANPSLRMTIAPSGNVVIATPDAGVGLTVQGGGITATLGDVNITAGDLVISDAATGILMPGPVFFFTGAGAPAGGSAVHVGDLYINTAAATATTRLYIATAVGTWTNVTCAG